MKDFVGLFIFQHFVYLITTSALTPLFFLQSFHISDEPPASQRKYIGARVIDGVYTLIDPTEDNTPDGEDGKLNDDENDKDDSTADGTNVTTPTTGSSIIPLPSSARKRHGSVSSMSSFKSGDGTAAGSTSAAADITLLMEKTGN